MSPDQEEEEGVTIPLESAKSDLKVPKKDGQSRIECASDICGSGIFQRRITLLYIASYLVAAFQNYGITFYSETPNFVCAADHEDEQSAMATFAATAHNLTTTTNLTDSCFDKSGSKCTKFIFDHSFYRSTIVTEFDLVCDRSLYVSYSKSIYQIGYLISSILFGWISDRHGRKLAFRSAIVLELAASLSQALSVNIYHFLASRLILGIAAYSRFLTGMIILVEWAGSSSRARIRMISELGWSGGYLLLPITFYLIRDFRIVQLCVFFYELILLFWLFKFPESPQWLIAQGHYGKVTEELTTAALENKKGTREEVIAKLEILKKKKQENQVDQLEESKKTILDLWKIPRLLMYSLAQYFIWFSGAFVSYGVTYNAGDIGGNLYVNFLGFAVIDTLNNVVMFFIVDKVKRKTLFLMFAFTTAICLFTMVPLSGGGQEGYLGARITLLMIGKFASNGAFHLIYLMAAEIYPTGIRHIGVGSCSVAARFGSVAAPFVRELTQLTNLATTFSLFAILSLIGGLLGFVLPETKDQPIPDTLKEAERRKVKQDDLED